MLSQQLQYWLKRITSDRSSPHTTLNFLHSDALTRLEFIQNLNQLVYDEVPLLILYLNIDNFKSINDSLGRNIGDKVLAEVSSRLIELLPSQTKIGYLGSDEFGIIITKPNTPHAADIWAKRIISLMNKPFDLHHFSKGLSCSIGSARYPKDGTNAQLLIQNADTAMYEAKERGRNRLIKFSKTINKNARMRLWLEIELEKALKQNGLEVWYQPKVNAQSYGINGAEALLRWKHPIEGYISPSSFIPIAERSGLIENLGQIVMQEVFNAVKQWEEQDILPGQIAVNLSAEQFCNPNLITNIEKLLLHTGINPSCITFELTESTVMSNSVHTLKMLNAIKKLGFTLSIDDFGTGYSSLSYLARFPVDELKIDRTFIKDINNIPKQITVVENIINLGQSLNLNVVAEGVETKQQAALVSNLNCHSIQGFHFFHPYPKHEVEQLFTQQRSAKQ